MSARMPLHVRWLGPVRYREALTRCSAALHERVADDHLLLLEHPHVYTLGRAGRPGARARAAGRRSAPSWCAPTGAATSPTTGPGQLVGYPILSRARQAAAAAWPTPSPTCARSSSSLIDALADLGLPAPAACDGYPGVWVDPDGDDPARSPPSACG